MLNLAVQPDDQILVSKKRQSFSTRWMELAEQAGVKMRPVDVFRGSLREQLEGCDGFLWWFSHLPQLRRPGSKVMFSVAHGLGIPTFPNWQTMWHFDDKVAQKYLLDAAGIRTPKTEVFWTKPEALAYCRQATYPLVLKLAGGICSENVRKIHNASEAEYWISRLFGRGLTALDGLRKKPVRWARRHLHSAGRAMLGKPPADRTELQRGYVLLQEFMPDNKFDTRITVIGDRAFGFRRFNRDGDFRASGSGKFDWNRKEIPQRKVDLAFKVARKLGAQSIAVDILEAPDGELVMNEISYYYEGWVVGSCPGHWKPNGEWQEGQMAPEAAIFSDFVAGLREKQSKLASSGFTAGD